MHAVVFRGRAFAASEIEIPAMLGALLYGAGFFRGAGHKYIRRVPKPGGGYRYFYRVTGGHGLGHAEEMQHGAAFRVAHGGKEGHFHVDKVEGDNVHIRHDESGHKAVVSKAALRDMLHKEHATAIEAHGKRIGRDLEAAKKNKASGKSIAKLEAEKKQHEERFQTVSPEEFDPDLTKRINIQRNERSGKREFKSGEILKFKGKWYAVVSAPKGTFFREDGLSAGAADDSGWVWSATIRPATPEEVKSGVASLPETRKVRLRARDINSSGHGKQWSRRMRLPDGKYGWASDIASDVEGDWYPGMSRSHERTAKQLGSVPVGTVVLEYQTSIQYSEKAGAASVRAGIVQSKSASEPITWGLATRRKDGAMQVKMPDGKWVDV